MSGLKIAYNSWRITAREVSVPDSNNLFPASKLVWVVTERERFSNNLYLAGCSAENVAEHQM
jgi:hypothetical protein